MTVIKHLNILLVIGFLTAISAGAEELTQVELDAAQPGATISPLLFGHNLEITRQGVWRGLSAEMIANRKFAAAENGLPRRWSVIGELGRVALDNSTAYSGKQSIRLQVKRNGESSGISQLQEVLAFRKGANYALRLWLKTDANRTVKVRVSDTLGKPCFEKQWQIKTGGWQLLTKTFTAPMTEETNRLEISSQDAGVFWIGAVSLQPTSAFHGMRRDVIELLKQIKPGTLRYPGGCYAEYYRWQEGLLPVDQRPSLGPTGFSLLLPDTDDYDAQEIGIDEFIALCHELGSEPAVTVRLSENTPEDAAAWVEYCNGTADTRWGKIRVQRGQPEPYHVKCWFVGNELYGFGRGGLQNAEVCARQSKLFAQAMKAADSSIDLTGCTVSTGGEWNHRLIGEAGDLLDLFSVHDYLLDHFKGDLQGIAKAPTQILRPLLQNAGAGFQSEVYSGQRWSIAFDEWNTMWRQPGSVGMGLYTAGVLNLLCREALPLKIERAHFFMPINEGAIQVRPLAASLDIAGEIFALYKVHQGNHLLKTPEMPSDADLDLCASETPDGSRIYVTAINRNLRDSRVIELDLHNFHGRPGTAVKLWEPQTFELNARDILQTNREVKRVDGNHLVLMLPPGTIARVRFGNPGLLE